MRRWLIDGELVTCRLPLFQFMPRADIAFVFNEGGRGFTLSLYRHPLGLRIYLAGFVRYWGI
jgi:hypothetical protein